MAAVDGEADVGLDPEAERKRDKREWIAIALCIGLLVVGVAILQSSVIVGGALLAGAARAGQVATRGQPGVARGARSQPNPVKPVLLDEDGKPVPHPEPPQVYEDRPLIWVRYVLVVMVIPLGYLASRFDKRANEDAGESWDRLWLTYPDLFSSDVEGIVSALDAVIAGDDSKVNQLFILGSPYTDPERRESAFETIDLHEFVWQMTGPPQKTDLVVALAEWDRSMARSLSTDGATATDLSGLRAARDSQFLRTVPVLEAETNRDLRNHLDSLVDARERAAALRWVVLGLIPVFIACAEWIRVALRRAVERDNLAHQAALAEYERLEAQCPVP